jgi:hypothetical protein
MSLVGEVLEMLSLYPATAISVPTFLGSKTRAKNSRIDFGIRLESI